MLFSFLRASHEFEIDDRGLIYAIEEPETAQHFDNQRKLARSLVDMTKESNIQVIVTTHSPVIVKQLGGAQIRVAYDKSGASGIRVLRADELTDDSLNAVEQNKSSSERGGYQEVDKVYGRFH